MNKGDFTLPGEAGYEDLTMELAKKWGADAIRDSDGTVLSDKITAAGFDIYSTICLIRCDNKWAKANQDKLQQNYLMSYPVVAEGDTVTINLLDGYFREQFRVNTNDDPKAWWQVFDRTNGQEIPTSQWSFDAKKGIVTIQKVEKWHKYTVNFLAYRIWEEISMYNHVTNNWGDREHLMPIDPIYPQTQEFILSYLEKWLRERPRTKIVRFTSMFYDFAWFWGDSPQLRFIYADWGSYEMTVSPYALCQFAQTKGYKLTSEDFVNNGAYCSSHNVPSKRLLDWMDFINQFVVDFGHKCIDLVHKAGKQAYMFYDDHWVGTEPCSDRYKDFGFDGLIKCVFNAFEARLCAGVRGVKNKELRLHPYLFPTGLKGEPTFMKGGDPASDAKRFWANIRRGLLREPVDRIGLGGYLHLVQDFPDFVKTIEGINDEFRTIKQLHSEGRPYTAPLKAAVLTAWGKLRSWVYVGHFIHGMELYEVTESLAGLPIEVTFISFDDILQNGIPKDVKVIINAGRVNSAWSGGDWWKNEKIVSAITAWVAAGGAFLGVGEPSACMHSSQFFQLSHVLGIDRQTGETLGLSKRRFTLTGPEHFILQDLKGDMDFGSDIDNVFVVDKDTEVLAEKGGSPRIAVHNFKKGKSIYLSGYKFTPANTRLLHRALFWAARREGDFGPWTCSNIYTDCAYFPKGKKLVVMNSSDKQQKTKVFDSRGKTIDVSVESFGIKIMDM
ncbi:MAG: 1,3-beta-galactosyl-N-acetylhexosamine phosphorylase [Planctomycetes bacterium RBG_13_44_8b]|nr:MAG: 1,3-beta-galactosyl-N-acetylhexosamine phosphorylase [Planctomycetes bacterium RBG_13_44_8b]